MNMIELFLSTDGKQTVHVTADTPEQMAELAPKAKALYREVVAEFGTKAQMWQTAINGSGNSNNNTLVSKRIDTVAQAREAVAPRCPMHQTPMALRHGRLGDFWSCPTRKPDGSWCPVTKEVSAAGNGQVAAA
jgi:hypothetical protein